MNKLSCAEVMKLTPEERVEYNKKMNADRVAKYRAANKEKAKEYNYRKLLL